MMNENGKLSELLARFKVSASANHHLLAANFLNLDHQNYNKPPFLNLSHQSTVSIQMSKAPKDMCLCCGNAKFIACQQCNGSRKSMIRHFKFNSIALRCIKCDKNDGLVRCPICCGRSGSRGGSSACKLGSIDEGGVDSNNNNLQASSNTNKNMIK